jgi:AcrR family transcriptional regulator
MSPEDRRDAIITAVCPLLEEQGTGLTTKQIAEAAGIAEGTIFRVFRDKQELLLAAVRATLDPAVGNAEIVEALRHADDLESTLLAIVTHLERRMRRIVAVMTALHQAMAHEGGGHPGERPELVENAGRDTVARIAARLEPYADQMRVPPETAARLIRSVTFGSFMPMTPAADRPSADEIVSVLLDGVRAHPTKEDR